MQPQLREKRPTRSSPRSHPSSTIRAFPSQSGSRATQWPTSVLRSEMAVDREIPRPAGPLRLRTFVPDQVDAVFLHIHGGGFVTGSPEMTDLLHEILSKELNLAFVSVDYRLAPEHPYPAGPDDCEAAALWLLEHAEHEFGSAHLLIGGESAGAHLAACTLLRLRDRDAVDRFCGANLVFGIYDLGRTPSQRGDLRASRPPHRRADPVLRRAVHAGHVARGSS